MTPTTGLYVPVITPLSDDKLDLASLSRLCGHLVEQGAQGLVAGGSTGEAASLTEDELGEVVATVAKQRVPTITGIVASGTSAALRHAEIARLAGASAVLVMTPPLLGATAAQVVQHYRTIASEQPLPVYIYHFPARSGIQMTASDVVALANDPNIVGIKNSPPTIDTFLQEVIATAPDGFSVLAGNASAFWPALALGAAGGILAGANVLAAELRAIWDAATEGDLPLAKERHRALWYRYAEVEGIVTLKRILSSSGLISSAEARAPLGR